ncbi:hypothetical protein JTE90_020688 [Oedothorax gibbosus]|uniref:Uncharacterized protein n=1 Tax=Oedothorax gibbosus TaxID=931172 RepID=A0AAV6V564_9ARAC|nr:hypothetical protein JTE90_020688 [Oedothorax gibbosus]
MGSPADLVVDPDLTIEGFALFGTASCVVELVNRIYCCQLLEQMGIFSLCIQSSVHFFFPRIASVLETPVCGDETLNPTTKNM